jgi:hypothetical protein
MRDGRVLMIDWFKVRGEAWIAPTVIASPSRSYFAGRYIRRYQTSYPFAKLSASPEKLTVSILFDSYTFTRQDIVAFEPGVQLFRGEGFRIRHCVSNYPEFIVFRGLGDPEQIIRCIHATGFYPEGSLYSAREAVVPARGSPWRLWTILVPLLLMIVPFFFLKSLGNNLGLLLKVFRIAATTLCIVGIVIPLATLKMPFLQRLFLKPGRSILEVRGRLRAAAFGWGVVSLLLLDRLIFRR